MMNFSDIQTNYNIINNLGLGCLGLFCFKINPPVTQKLNEIQYLSYETKYNQLIRKILYINNLMEFQFDRKLSDFLCNLNFPFTLLIGRYCYWVGSFICLPFGSLRFMARRDVHSLLDELSIRFVKRTHHLVFFSFICSLLVFNLKIQFQRI